MREEFKLLLSDKVHRNGLIVATAIIAIGFIFFLVKVWWLPPLLPLFYHRPWGMPQLGTPWHLFVILLASVGIFLFNLTLSLKLYRQVILLSRILLWVAVLISLLTTTTVIRIILLVT